MKASGCSTSTRTSASTAERASRSARSRRSSTRTTCRRSGRTTTRPTSTSSTTSARRVAPPRPARSTRTTRWWRRCRRRNTTSDHCVSATQQTGVLALPDFPWDSLAAAKERAAAHPGGLVDLSVGTPVDPVPQPAQRALAEAANSPGYPLTSGTAELRAAMADYLTRRWGAVGLAPEATMPVIGTKEFVAWLPTLLGLGPGDTVVVPTMAYPTYTVGAMIAGCT